MWKIKQLAGGKDYLMRAHFGLPSVKTGTSPLPSLQPLSSSKVGRRRLTPAVFDCVDVFNRGGTRPNSHNRPFRDSVLHSVGSSGSVP